MSKVARNSPCPCGSGKKYKKCCLAKDKETRQEPLDASLFDNESVDGTDDEYGGWDDEDEGDEWNEEEGWVEEESDGYGEAGHHDTWDTESPYPQIDQELPDLPEDQQAIVDEWWDSFMPIYEKRDADEMVRRLVAFAEAQPGLFVHLGLDDECLFELGAELARRGEHARHVDLLQRIRRDHPEVYIRSHGFYDVHIVAELILTGQRDAIPQYFNFYREYPDSNPDELSNLVDLLLATNCQAELFELVRATGVPCMRSPKVFGGGFAYHWYVFEQWVPFLDRGDASEAACQELLDALMAIDHPFEPKFELELIARDMRWAFDEDPVTNLAPLCTAKTLSDFHRAVSWNFTRHLHENRGMSWATARFFAERLDAYLRDLPLKKRSKRPFPFEKQRLDQYLAKNCMFFMWLQGVKAISLLQAIHEFAGYLEVHPVGPSEPPDTVRQVCLELMELCKKGASDPDQGPRIFADFPEYRWAEAWASIRDTTGETGAPSSLAQVQSVVVRRAKATRRDGETTLWEALVASARKHDGSACDGLLMAEVEKTAEESLAETSEADLLQAWRETENGKIDIEMGSDTPEHSVMVYEIVQEVSWAIVSRACEEACPEPKDEGRGRDALVQLLSKAIEMGGEALEVEYKDGYEEICVFSGHMGLGIDRLESRSQEARSLRKELWALHEKKRDFVEISGVEYEVRVRTYDSFGEDAFRVKFAKRR